MFYRVGSFFACCRGTSATNIAGNFARFNINRSTESPPVNTTDLLRLVQLLNGVGTTQVFNGAIVAACP